MEYSRTQSIQAAQTMSDQGMLRIRVFSAIDQSPIPDASVQISYTGQPDSFLEELQTDSSGNTPEIRLPAPPLEYSMDPSPEQPYAEYSIQVTAPGYEKEEISGSELFSGQISEQQIAMKPVTDSQEDYENIIIPAHTLYAEYPPKIPEEEIKPINETGEIVLSRVVIPEYIVVHDGAPTDSTARDYYVRYKDYIKNVASSEIYATWSENTIRANVLAIMSFTLNRVYTEWYRNKGYDFTITSSTAYDHKWIAGRNYYENISRIVDELYENYLSRPNVRQPILTQYCDGRQVECESRGWMTQWGSKYLGDQGYTPIEILRFYYGSSLYINTAEEISGVPASWPRVNLTIGSEGQKVFQMQEQLNVISRSYPAIPRVRETGVYDELTQESVQVFQNVFGLSVTGIVDYRTWYKIQEIYVGVSRIGELN